MLLFSQEVQLKQVKYGTSEKIKEAFYVLEEDETIRHGEFKSYFHTGKLRTEGHFKNNEKDRKWIIYESSGLPKEIQHYQSGKKTGVWEKYVENRYVIEKYDQDKEKLLGRFINAIVSPYYPALAREDQIEGTVKIKILFDQNCKVIDFQPLTSLGYNCEEEAIKALKRMVELSKKYEAQIEGCEKGTKVVSFDFKLK